MELLQHWSEWHAKHCSLSHVSLIHFLNPDVIVMVSHFFFQLKNVLFYYSWNEEEDDPNAFVPSMEILFYFLRLYFAVENMFSGIWDEFKSL